MKKKNEVPSSGHYMVSSVAEDEENKANDDVIIQTNDDVIISKKIQYNLSTTETIDGSLTSLFQHMKLAYNQVVSPKWKNFKGMKLKVKDKIRLNNVIWRTWHIQYIKRVTPKLIQFSTPLEGDCESDMHSKPEAVVLEGKYWKRKIKTVVQEYQNWRTFFSKKMNGSEKFSKSPSQVCHQVGLTSLKKVSSNEMEHLLNTWDHTSHHHLQDFSNTINDFASDTLFSSNFSQPIHFPDPRELHQQTTNSDMIQPGLLQLQPPVADSYDTEFNLDPWSSVHQQEIHQTSINKGKNPQQKLIHMNVQETQQQSVLYYQTDEQTFLDPMLSSSVRPGIAPQGFKQPEKPQKQNSRFEYRAKRRNSNSNGSQQQVQVFTGYNEPTPMEVSEQQPLIVTQPTTFKNTVQNGNQVTVVSGQPGDYQIQPNQLQGQPIQSGIVHSGGESRNSKVRYVPGRHRQGRGRVRKQTGQQQQLQVARGQSNLIAVTSQQHFQLPMRSQNSSQLPMRSQNSSQLPIRSQNNGSVENGAKRMKQLLNSNPPPVSKHQVSENRRSRKYSPGSHSNQQQYVSKQQWSPQPPQQQSTQGITNFVSPSPSSTTSGFMSPLVIDMATSPSSSDTQSISNLSNVGNPLSNQGNTQHGNSSSSNSSRRENSVQTAEHKRRLNIKLAFEKLQGLIPTEHQQDGSTSTGPAKISKAMIMTKSCRYMRMLQGEKNKNDEQVKKLQAEVESLKNQINQLQMQLPETGIPEMRPKSEDVSNRYQGWVREKSSSNWKFFLFASVMRPWFESYHGSMHDGSAFRDFMMNWTQEKCSLAQLRQNVVNTLQMLSTKTSILTDPDQLEGQVMTILGEEEVKRKKS